ncbi:MAG: SMC-Scp complex subunit ScpB [Deltaproteobacteria bacterium]|nr:SMC-Scp complex subunit ScpB [Deltaproteobacteria bacterium]
MSDDTLPPEDENDAIPPFVSLVPPLNTTPSEEPETEVQSFFDDDLDQSPNFVAEGDFDVEEMTEDGPSPFPIPIELGTFHGVVDNDDAIDRADTEQCLSDDAPTNVDDNVISLLPRFSDPGAVWELSPAGEEKVREPYDENAEAEPPEQAMLEGTIEALLFSADGPLSENQLNQLLAEPGLSKVRDALYSVQDRFRRPGSGIRLVQVAKGWQLRTDMRTAKYVAAMRGEKPVKLSKAALETLSIIAYRQPVTRAEVEDLRGVDPGGIIRMLAERGLISVTGRKEEPGRPLLYGTTRDFLSLFGLRDLSDLPTLRDLRELQRDDARDGIGGTDMGLESALVDAVVHTSGATPNPDALLHPIQEQLPLESHEPID